MNSTDRNSLIRHACGGIVLIAIIVFYPTYALVKAIF